MSLEQQRSARSLSGARLKVVEIPSLDRRCGADRRSGHDLENSEAFKLGYNAGIAAAEKKSSIANEKRKSMSEKIDSLLHQLEKRYRQDSIEFTSRLVGALAPGLTRLAAYSELNAMLEECAPPLGRRTNIAVGEGLSDMRAINSSELVKIEVDEKLPCHAVVASWDDGGACFFPDDQISDLLLLFEKLVDEIKESA